MSQNVNIYQRKWDNLLLISDGTIRSTEWRGAAREAIV
jgi:hypothetical protein